MRLKFLPGSQNSFSPTSRLSLLFSLLFLFGVIVGVLTAAFLNIPVKQALYSDLSAFVHGEHLQRPFIQSLWKISQIPLLIICMSFTCFGVVTIPLSVVLQGYLLSFSVSTMIRLLGWQGCLLGFANFGIQALILVPCVLILSVQGFQLSKRFFKTMLPATQDGVKFPRGFVLASFCCLFLLVFGAILDCFLTEHSVSLVLNHFIF